MRGALIVIAFVLAAAPGCVGQIVDTSAPATNPGTDGGTGGSDASQPLGVRDCTVPGACPCTTNYDCQTGFSCVAETEAKIYCSPGARGTGRLGQACPNGGRDCVSGVCVTPSAGPPVCSDTCTDAECNGTTLPTCTDLNASPAARLCL